MGMFANPGRDLIRERFLGHNSNKGSDDLAQVQIRLWAVEDCRGTLFDRRHLEGDT